LRHALQVDYVVVGGGSVKRIEKLPSGCRPGSNANAFTGGVRLWETDVNARRTAVHRPHSRRRA
jgi:hypothetical protein